VMEALSGGLLQRDGYRNGGGGSFLPRTLLYTRTYLDLVALSILVGRRRRG
jgi:hypothetical protein